MLNFRKLVFVLARAGSFGSARVKQSQKGRSQPSPWKRLMSFQSDYTQNPHQSVLNMIIYVDCNSTFFSVSSSKVQEIATCSNSPTTCKLYRYSRMDCIQERHLNSSKEKFSCLLQLPSMQTMETQVSAHFLPTRLSSINKHPKGRVTTQKFES